MARLFLLFALLLASIAAIASSDDMSAGTALPSNAEALQKHRLKNGHYLLEVDGMPQLHNYSWVKPGLMRRVLPVGAPYKLVSANDPAIAKRLSDKTQPWLYAHFKLDVDAKGTVVACGMDDVPGNSPDIALIEAQCPVLVQRAKFHPALDDQGNVVADAYRLSLVFVHRSSETNAAIPAVSQREMLPSDMAPPPPTPNYAKADLWPLTAWMLEGSSKPAFAVELAPNSEASRILPGEPVSGVVIALDKEGKPLCTVITGAEAGQEKADACKYVKKTLKPVWPNVRYGLKQYPLLIVGKGKAMRAVKPSDQTPYRAQLNPDHAAANLRAMENALLPTDKIDDLWISVDVGPDGKAVACRINQSSGSIAGDVAACKAMRDNSWFISGVDIFGQTLPKSNAGWNAKFVRGLIKTP